MNTTKYNNKDMEAIKKMLQTPSGLIMLESALTTIVIIKLEEDVWKIFSKPFENIEYYTEDEVIDLIDRKLKKGFDKV